ncbi:MAG: glycosyltransferase [Flavobacterium sp.]
MPKKILIVTKGFYPENSPRAFRATELAKAFVKQGHEVTVLLPKNEVDYSSFLADNPMSIKTFRLKYGRLTSKNKFIGEIKRKIGRVLFLLFEYPNIEIMFRVKKELKNVVPYDLMISIAVPHAIHWGIAAVRTEDNPIAKTWVADCGDPFMGNTLETIRPPFWFKYLEKSFGKKADYITVPTETSVKAYYPEFHSKIVVIPQGFDFDEIKINHGNEVNPVPTFAYAGGVALSGIRSPKLILDYLLEQGKDFRFHIFSNNSTVLEKYGKHPQIVLHEAIPRPQLLQELAKMDFLLNLNNGTVNQTPSKLIDYSLVKKPILDVQAENPDFAVIDEFMNGDYRRKFEVKDLDRFSIQNVALQFLNLHKNN